MKPTEKAKELFNRYYEMAESIEWTDNETKVKAEAKYYFYHIPNVFENKIFNIFDQLFSKKIENINENKNKTFIH